MCTFFEVFRHGDPNHDRDIRTPGYHQDEARSSTRCLGNISPGLAGVQSHIHGPGLADRLEPRADSQGMVGWAKATKAASMILKMVQQGQGRKSDVVCWVSIDGKDRYCTEYGADV